MFRLERMVLLCLLPPLLQGAGVVRGDAEPEVVVCLRLSTSVPYDLLMRGETTASALFEDIGVKLRWTCRDAASSVAVRVTDRTPKGLHRGAFAYALPYAHQGDRVVVFYDRFAPLTISNPILAPVVFGHILAHEIGHVLAGVATHADRGLMRAKWTDQDLIQMRVHRLRFTADSGNFIYRNVTHSFESSQKGAVRSR